MVMWVETETAIERYMEGMDLEKLIMGVSLF